MATGYTYMIIKDKKEPTFQEFAFKCMQAFSWVFRDNNLTIEEVIAKEGNLEKMTDDNYYSNELKATQKELKKLLKMTDKQFANLVDKEYKQKIKVYNEKMAEQTENIRRLNVKIKEVEAWNPPTENHVAIKEFMLEQLKMTIDSETYDINKPIAISVDEYKKTEIDKCTAEIKYYQEKIEAEHDRINHNNLWTRTFLQSIGLLK
jgi:hypothetical protein